MFLFWSEVWNLPLVINENSDLMVHKSLDRTLNIMERMLHYYWIMAPLFHCLDRVNCFMLGTYNLISVGICIVLLTQENVNM